MLSRLHKECNIYIATIYQVTIVFILLWLTRPLFYFYNESIIGHIPAGYLWGDVTWRGIPFDLSAVIYFNALFILMRFLPFGFVTARRYIKATDIIYYITNALLLIINIVDIPFFAFQGSRMRFNTLTELTTDSNMLGILCSYIAEYLWVVLLVAGYIYLLIWLYRRVRVAPSADAGGWKPAVIHVLIFLAAAGVSFLLMRGTFNFRGARGTPLSIGHAAKGAKNASEINVVLNTPFCILRSVSGSDRLRPYTFYDSATLESLRTSVITPSDSIVPNNKNVVLIILEGGSSYFTDHISPIKDEKLGLMPFLDSLSRKSLTVLHNFATGRRSNEGVASILGSFPNFEPFIFMRSPYNANHFDAFPRLLRDRGYSSTFYYGCNQGSYNIEQIAMTMGIENTVNRDTYDNDDDFDGMWGIFDDKMARYVASRIGTMRPPFTAVWFTLSSHAPFAIPDGWDTSDFKNKEAGMGRSVEYTDDALRIFFETASQQPWYDNTIFIITADHGNREWKDTKYDTAYYQSHIPFIVYAPDGSIPPRQITDRVMSQFDIGPTILGLTGHNTPYVSIGTDILAATTATHYALSKFNHQYRINSLRYTVIWDDQNDRITGVYDIANDPELTTPLTVYDTDETERMTTYAKALLQDFTERITTNRMSLATTDPAQANK